MVRLKPEGRHVVAGPRLEERIASFMTDGGALGGYEGGNVLIAVVAEALGISDRDEAMDRLMWPAYRAVDAAMLQRRVFGESGGEDEEI